ncbi:MAG: hypothetical protein JJT89_12650 [Nitriliruptoraceae bacterium]|nr:hypothetical protein [Nitriliruptoraceae bacterium]
MLSHEEGPRREGIAARAKVSGQDDRGHPTAGMRRDDEAPSLFDAAEESRRRRDAGREVALYSSDVRWKAAAEDAIRAMPGEFTAEDLRARVGHLASSPNALGAVIAAAARRGEIVQTGWRTATRPEAHARGLRTWRVVADRGPS